MKNKLFAFLSVLMSLSSFASINTDFDRFREVTDSLTPMFVYNMNVSLYKTTGDSICAVSKTGKLLFKVPRHVRVAFNSNIDFEDEMPIQNVSSRYDVNLNSEFPIILTDIRNQVSYAVDYYGNTVIEKGKYDFISPFIDGYSMVAKDGKWGVINASFEEVVPLIVSDSDHFFINHNVWVYNESEKKWYMIDSEGKNICSYDRVECNVTKSAEIDEFHFRKYFKNRDLGITIVRKGGKWGAVDKNGSVVIPLVNESPSAVYRADNGMWFYGESVFDSNGNLIFSPSDPRTRTYIAFGNILTIRVEMTDDSYFMDFEIYDASGKKTDYLPLPNGLKWHLIGNEWILEDKLGHIVSGSYVDLTLKHDCPNKDKAPWSGDSADEFFNVVDEGKAGLIDKNGKFILPMKYSSCSVDHNALKGTILDGRIRYVAFYDFNGKEIQPMALHKRLAYENFGWHYEGTDCTLDAYQVNGKWGLLDMETKKTVVPFCLDDVLAFMNGVGVVKYKGRLYYINEKGEGLPDEAYQTK